MSLRYFGVCVVILIFGVLGIFNPIRFIFHRIFNPVQFGLSKLSMDVSDAADFIVNLHSIYMTNAELSKTNAGLISEIITLKKYEEENVALKSQLGQTDNLDQKRNLLLANVMGNSSDLSSLTVYIDKGSRQGVKLHNNVIFSNYLIGIVKEVFDDKSLIELITSPSLSVTVYNIDSPMKTEGLAVGQYGTSILMQRILPNEDINIGNTVVSSGRDGIVLPGLIIGKVTKVNQVEVEPLKSAFLETLIDISKLRRVFVVVN